jgi:hypothetical protein
VTDDRLKGEDDARYDRQSPPAISGVVSTLFCNGRVIRQGPGIKGVLSILPARQSHAIFCKRVYEAHGFREFANSGRGRTTGASPNCRTSQDETAGPVHMSMITQNTPL